MTDFSQIDVSRGLRRVAQFTAFAWYSEGSAGLVSTATTYDATDALRSPMIR